MPRFIVSLDIETCGLDRAKHNVLQFSAILENLDNPKSFDETPKFTRFIRSGNDTYVGTPFALNLNAWIFKILNDSILPEALPNEDLAICNDWELGKQFRDYLASFDFDSNSKTDSRIHIVAAGKNVAGFDLPFLSNLPNWDKHIQTGHGVIDPGMLYFDFSKDSRIPGGSKCCQIASVTNANAHSAVYDAWMVIELLRPFYTNSAYGWMQELVKEYSKAV